MTNSRFNRTLRTGIPILFGMMLVVNCVSEGGSGSGCASPVAPTQTPHVQTVVSGTVFESRNGVVTNVPDVTLSVIINPQAAASNILKVKTNGGGNFRLHVGGVNSVEVRPSREGYRFNPTVYRGRPRGGVNFTASRTGG